MLQTLLERLSEMHSAMKIAACDKAIDEHLRHARCGIERLRGRWKGKWNHFPLPDEFFTLPNEHRSSPLTGSLFFRDYEIRKAPVRIWHGVSSPAGRPSFATLSHAPHSRMTLCLSSSLLRSCGPGQGQSFPTRCDPGDAGVIPTRKEPGEAGKRRLSG